VAGRFGDPRYGKQVPQVGHGHSHYLFCALGLAEVPDTFHRLFVFLRHLAIAIFHYCVRTFSVPLDHPCQPGRSDPAFAEGPAWPFIRTDLRHHFAARECCARR
jgi:hypothetical protein